MAVIMGLRKAFRQDTGSVWWLSESFWLSGYTWKEVCHERAVSSGRVFHRGRRWENKIPRHLLSFRHKGHGSAMATVVIANGTGIPARKYRAIFRHLASWGFIVVGNQEEWAWEGKSSSKSQDIVLRENDNPQSPLYHKVDTMNIGLVGHSQGGWRSTQERHALATAIATRRYAHKAEQPLCWLTVWAGIFWRKWKHLCWWWVAVEILMPKHSVNLTIWRSHTKASARSKDTWQNQEYWSWRRAKMRWCLYDCMDALLAFGDTVAAKCFIGNDAEILTNEGWRDVKREGM